MTSVAADGHDLVVGSRTQWGLGVGVDTDGWGMGGVGGSFGWWSEPQARLRDRCSSPT